ncbi:MAG TPA: hypothetical protein VIH37_00025 [Candidatus Limnocylindrales bacterium]
MSVRARRLAPAIVGALLAVVLATSAATADPGTKLLDASLTGIPTGGLVISGVPGGGIPWRLDRGDARLFADGRLQVSVQHLVLAAGPLAGTNPVPTGRAIVACSGAALVMTDVVPFSPDGNAMVDAQVALPSPCLAPVVFFAGQTAAGPRWFAVSGG